MQGVGRPVGGGRLHAQGHGTDPAPGTLAQADRRRGRGQAVQEHAAIALLVNEASLTLTPNGLAADPLPGYLRSLQGKYPDIVVTDYAFSNKRGRAMIYY